MLSHKQIWAAIDALAARHGHSPSGLAKAAGLDPTTFNKSKRTAPNGRLRWPSTESLSKILQVTGASTEEFLSVASRPAARPSARRIKLMRLDAAAGGTHFDSDGAPVGKAWDEIAFPDIADDKAFAVEVTGESAAPVYRRGDTVICVPGQTLRRGDRVLVRSARGELALMEFLRKSAKRLELKSLNPALPDRMLDLGDVDWLARVVWVAQ